jgi:O-antigen ligase
MSAAPGASVGIRPASTLAPVQVAAVLLLWGTFLLKFPEVLALGLGIGGLVAWHYLTGAGRIDRINGLILLNFVFWLVSGFATGGLTGPMLADPSWYPGEGRIFIYYMPFLLMSCVHAGESSLRRVVRHCCYLAVLSVLLYFPWLAAKPALLSGGRAGNYFAFMTSHTGAGTFFSVLCVFLTIYGSRTRSRLHFWLGVAMLLPVLGSASREALVALLAVLAWYLRREISLKTVLVALVLVGLVVGLMPVVAPHTAERSQQVFRESTLQDIQNTASTANWEPGQDKDLQGEEFNILSRILYWSYAIKEFGRSPFLGAGFGRFNDLGVKFSGVPGLYYVGVSGQNNPGILQAHNSYLQMLAETGVIGLALLLAVWIAMWRRISAARRAFAAEPQVAAYFEAAQGLVVFAFVAALFGHALAAPTLGVPVLTILGLGISYSRWRSHVAVGAAAGAGTPAAIAAAG